MHPKHVVEDTSIRLSEFANRLGKLMWGSSWDDCDMLQYDGQIDYTDTAVGRMHYVERHLISMLNVGKLRCEILRDTDDLAGAARRPRGDQHHAMLMQRLRRARTIGHLLNFRVDESYWTGPERISWPESEVFVKPAQLYRMMRAPQRGKRAAPLRRVYCEELKLFLDKETIGATVFVRRPLAALSRCFRIPPLPRTDAIQRYMAVGRYFWPEISAFIWRELLAEVTVEVTPQLRAKLKKRLTEFAMSRGYITQKEVAEGKVPRYADPFLTQILRQVAEGNRTSSPVPDGD